MDGLAYELDRLKEVYTILFPNERTLIYVVDRVDFSFRPKKILLDKIEQFLRLPTEEVISVEIGEEFCHYPQHVFLITADFKSKNSDKNYVLKNNKRNRFSPRKLLRDFIVNNTPLVYEVLRSLVNETYSNLDSNYIKNKNVKTFPFDLEISSKPKLNALVAIHWLDVGGAESFAVDCCDILDKLGYSTIIVSAYNARNFYKKKLTTKYKVYEIDRQVPAGLEERFITGLISKNDISLIHNHHNYYIYNSLPLIKKQQNICVVDSLHIDELARYGGGYPRISISFSNYIDYHHVISQRLKNLLLTNGVCENKIVFGHLAKNLNEHLPYSLDKSIDDKIIRLCFIGRMSIQKRPLLVASMFILAAAQAKKQGFKIEVKVVGDGELGFEFRKLIHKSKFSVAFKFFEANANVDLVLQDTDILLLGSENEGVTLVAFEAYRNGCIVISTDVGGQKEFIPKELLLPSKPLQAYYAWKKLFIRILVDSDFRKTAQDKSIELAMFFSKQETADKALTLLFKKTL